MEQQGVFLLKNLREAGFEAYWVGGCVRDRLLGRPLTDIDIATNAPPGEVARLFPDSRFVGASFGVTLVRCGEWVFEVATYRRDGHYSDGRRPDTVEFGSLEEDALRRDFTVNALYFDPISEQVIDRVGGLADLRAGLLRAVGKPRERFREDALRLLRAVRFAARFGFQIEEQTWKAMVLLADLVDGVSAERVRDELTRMLTGEYPAQALRLLDDAWMLRRVLPEIAAMKGVEQGREYHPEGDVFVHTLLALEKLDPRTDVTAWAMLLHDVGKPRTFEKTGEKITFYQHEKVGAGMALEICRRLRFSHAFGERVSAIVGRHMRFMTASQWRTSTMRRFLAAETIEEDLAVHRADCLASHGDLSAWVLVGEKLAEARSGPGGEALPSPIVTGEDLKALGLAPGPRFKVLLEKAREWQLEGEVEERAEALERLEKLLREDELRQGG